MLDWYRFLLNIFFNLFLLHTCRYPYDEAATVALSTIKEFSQGLKEVRIFLWYT